MKKINRILNLAGACSCERKDESPPRPNGSEQKRNYFTLIELLVRTTC